jgi:hypothetical protein
MDSGRVEHKALWMSSKPILIRFVVIVELYGHSLLAFTENYYAFQTLRFFLWKSNARGQARQTAGARHERTLFAVACTPSLGWVCRSTAVPPKSTAQRSRLDPVPTLGAGPGKVEEVSGKRPDDRLPQPGISPQLRTHHLPTPVATRRGGAPPGSALPAPPTEAWLSRAPVSDGPSVADAGSRRAV